MGAAASAASPPPEAAEPATSPRLRAAAPAASPPLEAAALADPPAKEDIQHGAAADPPSEAAAPVDSPSKEEIKSAEPADSPAIEEIQSAAPADAAGGDAETVVLDGSGAESGVEEEQGECGFCLYMKGGGCREEFIDWEKCIEVAEQEGGDIVERCARETTALRLCMDRFPDYYEVILSAEKRMGEDLEDAVKAEAEARKASPDSPPAAAAAEGEQGDDKKQAEEDVVIVVDEMQDPAEEAVVVEDSSPALGPADRRRRG